MKVVAHKCPNCNANLKLKPGVTEGVCEYCKSSYTIDDEVIRIENKTTVEIKDDNDLEIAIATLDNFKEYAKSEILFKNLIERYGHKKEIYIYLVRSMTHDFKKQTYNFEAFSEITDFWEKYKSLAKPKDISKYEESMNEINKKYWHKVLIKSTGNFNYKKCTASIEEIENNWSNYIKYCDKNELTTLKVKYDKFLNEEKDQRNQRKKLFKLLLIIILLILLSIFLIDFISLYTEKANQKTNEIKLSEVEKNCKSLTTCSSTDFLKNYFEDTESELSIDSISLNKDNKLLDVTIKLNNKYRTSTEKYEFKLIDDMGPFISSKNCTYKDTETVDVNSCFEVYDFTDGIITNDKTIVEYDEKEFKSEGVKSITVSATDNDGNTTTKNIDINIIKTPITLDVKLSKELVVGETVKLIYTFEPNNIYNKEVEINYDENYLTIDKNNNVKGLKKGTTNICVKSKYDASEKCITIDIGLKCLNTYTFKFDGGSEETKTAGENFCTGTYKVYASVLNKSEFYSLTIKPKKGSREYVTIYKKDSFFNEEGTKYVFSEGTSFITEPGITQVKLVKVS